MSIEADEGMGRADQGSGPAVDTDPDRAVAVRGRAFDRVLVTAIVVVVLLIAGALAFVVRVIPREGEAPRTAAQAAVAAARAQVAGDPENPYSHVVLADAYFQYGFYDEALGALDDARSLEPTSSVAAYVEIGTARVYEAKGDSGAAREHYSAALKIEESFDAHYALGELDLAEGDVDSALDHWLKAMDIQPNAATVRVQIASIYEERGEYDLALIQLEEALKYIPDDVGATAAYERLKAQAQ